MSDLGRQGKHSAAGGGAQARRPFAGGRGGGPFGGHGIGMPAEKPKDFKKSFRRLLGYLKPRMVQLGVVFAMAVLSTLFAILSPKIMGQATTTLFDGVMMKLHHVPGAHIDFSAILHIVAILVVLYIVSAVFSYLQQFVMAGVAQRTVYDMRRDVNDKLARLPLSFFDSRTHGEIMSRVTNDVDNIASSLQQSLTQIITSVITILGVLVMMLTISPLLTLITAMVLPLSFVMTRFILPRSQKYFTRQWANLGELNGHIEEMYGGHVIVKAFGHERKAIARFSELNEKLYAASWRAQFISGLMFPLMNFINNLGYVAVSVVGGMMVIGRAIQIGDVQAFIQYSRQFTMPIAQTANIANVLQSTIASAERVFELLDEPEEEPEEEPDSSSARSIATPHGAVAFNRVSFRYKEEAPLIKNMNLDVASGQTIAIVGPTGAGKTTLVNLLMRFYEVQGGTITVDGIDIRALRRGSLRRLFGMVLQDTWLFHGTIRENIGYGRSGATDEEIRSAALAAHADHFIRTLPDGYDTMLNEEASNISQGQRQLLTIARAILADPAILILDEATSSVDSRTEAHIQKAMLALMRGRTSFVIAHRLSTIRDADLILVMNNGSIVETGSHNELLDRRGFYAELYNSQFTGSGAVPEPR